MKHLAFALLALAAACSSATAPSNPCASDMAAVKASDGEPQTVTYPSSTSQTWGYLKNGRDPVNPGPFTVTFDWSSGSCVVTNGS